MAPYPVNVLWMTGGLGCDGDSIAMTAAQNPSFEDLLRGCLPGVPPLVIHNAVFAYETGADFMRPWFEAAAGKLDPFIFVLEGSVPNEEICAGGSWATFGVDPTTGEPISTCAWIDRLAPRAAVALALGTCAAYGGIPAMRGNPTGAMGLGDYLGAGWSSRLELPIVNLPGCPVQPDNVTETLLHLAIHLAGRGQRLDLDEAGRPRWLFSRTVRQGCTRAGFAEQGQFARSPADDRGCLVKLGCSGPGVRCNVPVRGWVGGVGGCPNVGGICVGCTAAGFPDRFMPFMQPDLAGKLTGLGGRLGYGALLRRLRHSAIRRKYDREPSWRRPGKALETGYELPW